MCIRDRLDIVHVVGIDAKEMLVVAFGCEAKLAIRHEEVVVHTDQGLCRSLRMHLIVEQYRLIAHSVSLDDADLLVEGALVVKSSSSSHQEVG